MAAPHWLRLQLAGPHGFLARPMAHLLNRFNRDDYARALKELAARPGETVLELGFGGGIGITGLLGSGARVLAAEPSLEMRIRAHRRFAKPLAEGRMEVWSCGAEGLPEGTVERALSMNTVYFWRDLERGLENLSRMVQKRLVLGISAPEHLREAGFAEEGFNIRELDWYQERVEAVGFATSLVPAPSENHCALLIGNVMQRR
jgi:hypothetical protein